MDLLVTYDQAIQCSIENWLSAILMFLIKFVKMMTPIGNVLKHNSKLLLWFTEPTVTEKSFIVWVPREVAQDDSPCWGIEALGFLGRVVVVHVLRVVPRQHVFQLVEVEDGSGDAEDDEHDNDDEQHSEIIR